MLTGRKARGPHAAGGNCKWQTFPPSQSIKHGLPKTNLSFLKLWADDGSTDQYSCQLFYGQGMTYLMPSYLKNAYYGRGAW